MKTLITEQDYEVLGAGLSWLPGENHLMIGVSDQLSEAEQQAAILQLQIAFRALPPEARLFPVKLHITRKVKPRVVFEPLVRTPGLYVGHPLARPVIVVNASLSEAGRLGVILKGMAFWQSLSVEECQEVVKETILN